jgi:hypothetical protein
MFYAKTQIYFDIVGGRIYCQENDKEYLNSDFPFSFTKDESDVELTIEADVDFHAQGFDNNPDGETYPEFDEAEIEIITIKGRKYEFEKFSERIQVLIMDKLEKYSNDNAKQIIEL